MLHDINIHTIERGSTTIKNLESLSGDVVLCISPLYEDGEDPGKDIVAVYELFNTYRNSPNFSLFYCVIANNFMVVNPHIMGCNNLVTNM